MLMIARLPAVVAIVLSIACEDRTAGSREAIELAKNQVVPFNRPTLVQFGAPLELQTIYLTNEARIQQELQRTKGDVSITGWTSRRISRDVFLAVYEASVNGEEQRWVFEVNLTGRLVRNLADDPALQQKYSDAIWRK